LFRRGRALQSPIERGRICQTVPSLPGFECGLMFRAEMFAWRNFFSVQRAQRPITGSRSAMRRFPVAEKTSESTTLAESRSRPAHTANDRDHAVLELNALTHCWTCLIARLQKSQNKLATQFAIRADLGLAPPTVPGKLFRGTMYSFRSRDSFLRYHHSKPAIAIAAGPKPVVIETLKSACAKSQRFEIIYLPPRRDRTKRRLIPYHLDTKDT
jgi:hypothetical protein